MGVVKFVALLTAAALMCASLRPQRPEFAMALSLAAGVMALVWAMDYIKEAVEGLTALARGAGMGEGAMALMLRAAGVAVLAEFGASLCRDAGESALAGRVELGGRVVLLSMSVPLMTGLVERLRAMLP